MYNIQTLEENITKFASLANNENKAKVVCKFEKNLNHPDGIVFVIKCDQSDEDEDSYIIVMHLEGKGFVAKLVYDQYDEIDTYEIKQQDGKSIIVRNKMNSSDWSKVFSLDEINKITSERVIFYDDEHDRIFIILKENYLTQQNIFIEPGVFCGSYPSDKEFEEICDAVDNGQTVEQIKYLLE